MKKVFTAIIALLLVFAFLVQTDTLEGIGIPPFFQKKASADTKISDNYDYVSANGVKYRVKAEGDYFYCYQNGEWKKTFMTGVNIGATEPGLYPGDLTVSYEDYYRWFQEISAMNVTSIRVYTVLRPQFYKALLDFNSQADRPLWLYQGVWVDEDDIAALGDVYAQNSKIANEFIEDAKDAVDVIHGNSTLPARAGYASGDYTADVSKYLAGWILGIEWDPHLVQSTNENNPAKNSFQGNYLYTLSATPFEAFLCSAGDAVITRETSAYGLQVPLAFVNWPTTDPLTHVNEPNADDDLVSVNVENIKSRDNYLAKQFACYNVYPYYPESLNYQSDYLSFKNEDGKIDTYEAYLKDLKSAHTMPILIGEFGVPTSRGVSHTSVMGYNQGGIDETKQGQILLALYKDIYNENYAGGMVFTWQDEWFKRTWNTQNYDVPDTRALWSNVQTNEQFFGLLAFDPGASETACQVDGDDGDWAGESPVSVTSSGELYMKSDERYVYFMLRTQDYDFNNNILLIPLDTISGQGNYKMNDTNTAFDSGADFVIRIHGKDDSRILVDSYYDAFYFLYGEQYKMIAAVKDIRTVNSGRFDKMMLCTNYEMTVPPQKAVVPFGSYETGKLKFGNSNPDSSDYQSLTDFCYKDGVVEIRIPWQLLNVMDPSSGKIMDNLYSMQSIVAADTSSWQVGMGVLKSPGAAFSISLNGKFSWEPWTKPAYHERLKPAYYELQEGLQQYLN